MIVFEPTTALAILAAYLYVLGILMVILVAAALKESGHFSVDTKRLIIGALTWPLTGPLILLFGKSRPLYDDRPEVVIDDFVLTIKATKRPQPDEPTVDPEVPPARRR